MTEPHRPSLADRYWRLPWLARIGIVIVGVVGALVVFTQVSRLAPDQATRTRPTSAASAPTTTPASPAPTVAAGQIGPGVWFVGTDVQPGTYRTTGPAELDGWCYWSRHDTAQGGPMDGIIASDGTYEGQLVVTIDASDVTFRTRGCSPWQPVG